MKLSTEEFDKIIEIYNLKDDSNTSIYKIGEFTIYRFFASALDEVKIKSNLNVVCYKNDKLIWYSDFGKNYEDIGYYQVESFSDDGKSIILYSFFGTQFIVELETGRCSYYGWHK